MKIAYFTHYLYNIKSGPGRFSDQLRGFNSNKIKFVFFSDNKISPNSREVKVPLIPLLNSLPGYWLIRSFLFYRAFRRSSEVIDIVICSNAFESFFLTKLIKNIPVIVMINDDNYTFSRYNFRAVSNLYSLRKSLSRYFGFYIERKVCQEASGIIACSDYIKKSIASFYKIDLSKIQIIYPAVDLNYFIPEITNRGYFRNDKIRVLFAKNDWRRGGLDIIIKGLSQLNSAKICLDIVGVSEEENDRILTLAKQLNFQNNINIVGVQSRRSILDKFSQVDILILCSRQEAFGVILLEAMATGTPIIATNVGGIPEVLDNGNAGFLIPANSPNELAELLLRVMNNPELVLPKIEYGLNQCKKFSTNILYSKLETLLLRYNKK